MDLTTAVRSRGYLALLVIAGLLGLPFGIVALAFIGLIHEGEKLVFTTFPEWLGQSAPPLWLLLLAPLVGGVLTGLAVHYLPGHGGHSPMVNPGGGEPIGVSAVPSVVLAALAGLSFGVVLGPEAPLIGMASGLGAWIASLLRKGDAPTAQLISLTAVFAMVAALFGGPIVAAVFIIETVALGGAGLTVAILPALTAAGTGYLAYTGFGSWSGIEAPVLAVPDLPADGPLTAGSFISAIVLGAAAGLLCTAVRKVGSFTLRLTGDRHPLLTTGAVGLLIGACAVSYEVITGAPGTDVLFSGQSALPTLAANGFTAATGTLLALLLLKSLAYGVALGGGFRGGPIFPALFLGTLLGVLAVNLLPGLPPLAGFAAGMAAGTAGMLRLPLSALVLVTVIVGPANAEVLPPVVVALVVAVVVATRLNADQPPTIAPDREHNDEVGAVVSAAPAASSP